MSTFKEALAIHAAHIRTVGEQCKTRALTSQSLVLPIFNLLGFNPFDPRKVQPGEDGNGCDYVLLCSTEPVMFVYVIPFGEELPEHGSHQSDQPENDVVVIVTNGQLWRFYGNFSHSGNLSATTPWFTLDMLALTETEIDQLALLRHACYRKEQLQNFAIDNYYKENVKEIIKGFLNNPSGDFVRLIAQHAGFEGKLSEGLFERMAELIKRTIADTVGGMVTESLLEMK